MSGEGDSIELYQDKRGEWRWRRTDSDGKVVGAACEGYKAKADCKSNANRGAKASDKVEVYQDKRGQWRWRRWASNGKMVGAATRGFKTEAEAKDNMERLA